RPTISASLREVAQTNAAVPSGPAITFCGMPFNKERTAARSPSFAAVTSGTLLVSAANAAPVKIVEPSSAARIVALMFIAVLPLRLLTVPVDPQTLERSFPQIGRAHV